MSSPDILAIDCGAGHVACGVLRRDKSGQLSLERFAIETFNPDPALESEWVGLLSQSLGELAKNEKLGGNATIGLPGHQTLSKFIKTPAVDKAKREKILQFEAQQNIPYPLSEVVWDHLIVADDGFDLEIMLGAVKSDVVRGTCAAVADAGIAVNEVSSSSIALLHCFRHNYPEVDQSVLVVDIGARSTNLLFVEGSRFFVRTIPLAGNSITQTISEEIRQDFAHCESLKVQVLSGASELPESSPARAAVAKAVQSFVGRLQLEITRSAVNYRRQSGAAEPTAVYLSGGGALIENIEGILTERLKLPVERLDPLRNISVGAGASNAAAYQSVLANVVGLAITPEPQARPFSLLPSEIGDQIAFRRRQPLLIAAAALLVLAFVPPLVYSQFLVAAEQARVSVYTNQATPLKNNQERLDTEKGRINKTREQIDALRSLAESKSNWINFFTDLQERLASVGDVWLDQLSVQRPQAASAGTAGKSGLFGTSNSAAASGTNSVAADKTVRLQISGRLMDYDNPVSRVSENSYKRVQDLLNSFTGSRFISAVESQRFNADNPGILQFDFVLVVDPERPL